MQRWASVEGRQLVAGPLHPRLHSALAAPQLAASAASTEERQEGPAPPQDVPPPVSPPLDLQPTTSDSSGSSGSGAVEAGAGTGAGGGGPAAAPPSHQQGRGSGQRRGPRPPGGTSKPRRQWQGRPAQGHAQGKQRQRQHGEAGREGGRPRQGGTYEQRQERYLVMEILHKKQNCREVVELVQRHAARRQLSARELTMACTRLGRLYAALFKDTMRLGGDADNNNEHCAAMEFHPGPQRLVTMVEVLLPQLSAFSPESFCAVIFSLACLRVRPDDAALTALLDAFEWQIPSSNNRQLVTVVWAIGALSLGSLVTERLWERLGAAVLAQEEDFNFSSAPFFLFGAARLQLPPTDELMHALLRKARQFSDELRTGDVSVILWALARLGRKVGDGMVSREFVEAMVARYAAHNRTTPATLRQVCALLFSCAHLNHKPPPEVLAGCIARIDELAAASSAALSGTDASMLLSAFEAFESTEGLALLKRHIMGNGAGAASEEAPGGAELAGDDLEMEDELRPTMQL
ncbi:expressed protein [Chlorella variabilis]|uniref:Expressed protein n=1 Tax=Chlorella variabilis TaxID=554065 RepID=E1ZAK4_CHLVA|nr:expressed protein [Chlorella variabilis]EFN57273.1 expressed protein [Chlorella variabilis]|eukprot:XP_005849375.1 expressed protein [Chlorella variabilis]